MKTLNALLLFVVLAACIFQGCRKEDFIEENMRKITRERWVKITAGMSAEDVVSVLGHPLEIVYEDDKQEDCSFWYSPKSEIFSSEEKVLVVSNFIVDFSSNKVIRTSVSYEEPEQRKRSLRRR